MKLGLQIPSFTWPGGVAELANHLSDIAKTADQAGFASVWVMDHFFQIRNVGEVDEPMLEGYTTLGFLAGQTEHARLGTLVTGVVYRHPGILAKTVSTLDVLSGGRANLGIGAAWNEQEARGLGIPFPPIGERFRRLEETLQIVLQMWSGDRTPYRGEYYQLEDPLNVPQPLSQPHPPILIGGMGEQKTLRLVAKYADACNFFARAGDDVLRHKLEVLQQRCEEVGRPYAEIEKTALMHIPAGELDTAQLVDEAGKLHKMGFQQLIISLGDVSAITPLERIGKEVIPQMAKL
jgi:F420-dependent oxidoreductase-like protein